MTLTFELALDGVKMNQYDKAKLKVIWFEVQKL